MSLFRLKTADGDLREPVLANNPDLVRTPAMSDALTDNRSFPDENRPHENRLDEQPSPVAPLTREDWEDEMRALVDLLNEAVMTESLRIEQLPGGRIKVLFPRVRTVWEG